MATRIPRSPVTPGSPSPAPEQTPPSVPVDTVTENSVAPAATEASEVSNVQAPAPVKEEPKFLEMAKADLDSIVEKLQLSLDSLKAQKQETTDQMDLIKLSAAKVLREATYKVVEMKETVGKMDTLHSEIVRKQQTLDAGMKTLQEKAGAYRTERDAFMKLKALSEKEFYEFVNAMVAKMKAEKEAK